MIVTPWFFSRFQWKMTLLMTVINCFNYSFRADELRSRDRRDRHRDPHPADRGPRRVRQVQGNALLLR